MRVLYLGANLRSKLSHPVGPELRAIGLMQGLEQAGIQVVPYMAGDKVVDETAHKIYSTQMKRLFPPFISNFFRDVYEIILDRQFYSVVEPYLRNINPDIILQQHARYGQVGVRLGRRYNLPVFLDDITPIWEEEQHWGRSLKLIARNMRKKVFSMASGLIAVSRDMETRLEAEGVPSSKIVFVPNGVDCTLFNPETAGNTIRLKYGLANKVVVGYVGSFQHWHRLDLLMQVAFSLIEVIPDIHFMLVGDDWEGRVSSMASEKGLSNWFTFPGGLNHSDVPCFLNAMDIAVLPRTLPYMSPMKIYEYMAMGKPVIAPNKNSIVEEVVIPYQNGLLFEAENTDSMKNAILTLATDSGLRQSLGKEARKSAQNNYTWFHQIDGLIQAFRSASPLAEK